VDDDLEITELSELAAQLARSRVDDFSSVASYVEENIVRFSNNSVTLTSSTGIATLELYLSKDRRRIVGATSNPKEEAVRRFVDRLIDSLLRQPQAEDYAPLPSGSRSYQNNPNFDPKLLDAAPELVEACNVGIGSAVDKGAERVAGIGKSWIIQTSIVTSGGVDASDRSSAIELNVRAFKDRETSGHGLSTSAFLNSFNPEAAGETAGDFASKAQNPGAWEEGKYPILLSPTVTADLLQHVGYAASAFSVLSGYSFLADQTGKQVARGELSMNDSPNAIGGIHSRVFDDEGSPCGNHAIIDHGQLHGYLHNCTTAKRFGTETTGNAGVIGPHPWNLEVQGGKHSLDEMLAEMSNGFYVTNNWYTRFQNMRAGEYSTIPRDAAFKVQDGRITHSVRGLRLSGSIPNQLKQIRMLGKERSWIHWWEVETPTLTPAMLIDDFLVSKAV
jgi:PmbA protein